MVRRDLSQMLYKFYDGVGHHIDTLDDGSLVYCHNGNWQMEKKYYEIMQYTGLKDKNGKEIYEGDICKFTNPNQTEIGVVIWDSETLGYGYDNKAYGILGLWLYNEPNGTIEVIGNIYKDLELIE